MAFTPDSRFIWLGCASLGMKGAIKLTVPDLLLADTVEIVGKISPTSRSESQDVHVQPTPLALHVKTSVYPGSDPPQAGMTTPYDPFVRVIDLTTKTDLLPAMPISIDEQPLTGPSSAYLAYDRMSYLVYRGQRESGSIAAYDVSTRRLMTIFAPLSEIRTADPAMQPEYGHWGLSNLIPIHDGRVIAALASGNWDGGLMIWDYRSGRRIQRIYGPGMSYIALSPDKTRVAGSFAGELYIYSLE
jgi:WD40 repeat protein